MTPPPPTPDLNPKPKPNRGPDPGAAAKVERFACPTCDVPPGSACRTRNGGTAYRYHTARFVLVPELGDAAEVLVPEDRGPGRPWTSSSGAESNAGSGAEAAPEPPPTRHRPVPPTAVRIGYASSSRTSNSDPDDLTGQLGALAAARCDQVFSEEVALSVKARPVLAEALRAADEARLADPTRPVTLTATELRRVARTTRELMELAAGLAARDVRLELLAGPLSGVFDPRGAGRLLFDVLAAAAGLDADHLRTKKLDGQRSAADEGRSSGRPRALDADMLALARQLRDEGVPVAEIAQQLTITSGNRAGRHPSVASVYRALAEAGPGGAVALAVTSTASATASSATDTATATAYADAAAADAADAADDATANAADIDAAAADDATALADDTATDIAGAAEPASLADAPERERSGLDRAAWVPELETETASWESRRA